MFSLLRHVVSIDEIIMFGKEIRMLILLPMIAVLTCLVVISLRVIDGAVCLFDIVKSKPRMLRSKNDEKYPR